MSHNQRYLQMRENVTEAIFDGFSPATWEEARESAVDTIRIVIEALAAEAEDEPFMDFTGDWVRSSSEGFAAWLRAHLDAGRDGEAGR